MTNRFNEFVRVINYAFGRPTIFNKEPLADENDQQNRYFIIWIFALLYIRCYIKKN